MVVNEAAGGGRTRRLWPDLGDDLRRLGLVFDWAPTTGRGTAIDLARAAAEGGAPLVVAVGGDGTLNEVVERRDAGDGAEPVVGVVLTGRGCDAARNLGLSTAFAPPPAPWWRASTHASISSAPNGPNGARRLVVTAAGAGFDASVARRTATSGGRGTLPYLRGIVCDAGLTRNHPGRDRDRRRRGVVGQAQHRRRRQRRLLCRGDEDRAHRRSRRWPARFSHPRRPRATRAAAVAAHGATAAGAWPIPRS